MMYSSFHAFNDITTGDNKCSSLDFDKFGHKFGPHGEQEPGETTHQENAQNSLCCGGYNAQSGWDPVTGLGTVDFAKLSKILNVDAKQEEVAVAAAEAELEALEAKDKL